MADRPKGYHTVTPAIVVTDSRAAMALYEKALGAEIGDIMDKDGLVIHAEFKVGDSWMFINDDAEFMPRRPSEGTQSTGFYLYIDDCDASFGRAVDAGMEKVSEPQDMFWGDRTAMVKDPYGYMWTFSERKEVLDNDEIEKRRKEAGW